MNNYSIFGPTIYFGETSRQQSQTSTPNINEIISSIFSPEINDIIQQSMTDQQTQTTTTSNNNSQQTTNRDTSTNVEEIVFFYDTPRNNTQGLSFQQINDNTTLTLFDSINDSEEEVLCSICHEEIHSNSIVRKINHCSHQFHVHCIDQWLNTHNNCPSCRHVLVEQQTRTTSRMTFPFYQFRSGNNS